MLVDQTISDYLDRKLGPGHGRSLFLLTASDRDAIVDGLVASGSDRSDVVRAMRAAAPDPAWDAIEDARETERVGKLEQQLAELQAGAKP